MNFIKKLFGMQSSSVINQEQEIPAQEQIEMAESMFTDQQPPVQEQKEVNRLKEFLDFEYAEMGYHDGYSYHSGDMLTNKTRFLLSEFRNRVDKQLEKVRLELNQLKEHRIEVEGLSGRMVRKIDLAIDGMMQTVSQLEQEKEHSAAEEGLVMKVVNEYREGFLRGMEDYQTEKLLGGNTGLFN